MTEQTEQTENKDETIDLTNIDPDDFRDESQKTFHEPEVKEIENFQELELPQSIIARLEKVGWTKPTPVQAKCLPFTVAGQDVAGFAQTGTGKTGVFLLTVMNHFSARTEDNKGPFAAVLVPTRELAIQVSDDAKKIFEDTPIKTEAVFGGMDYKKQADKLSQGVDVVIGTPGRLKDYSQKGLIDLKQIEVFVCDEADRMFDMGFIGDVEFFLDKIPDDSQKLLFSATGSEQVRELAFEYLNEPAYISLNTDDVAPENIDQVAIHCHATEKLRVMIGLWKEHEPECGIIFTNTKLTAKWLHYKLLNNKIPVDMITGDLPQKKRVQLIRKIKEGKVRALIATDVASRGLHISGVTHVFNFDLPEDPTNYVHRIGRTARAGASGTAISLVCDDYGEHFVAITNLLGENVVSSWFDEKYLEIEDKAGNPFAASHRSSSSDDKRRHDRGRRSSGRDRNDRDRPRKGASSRDGERDKQGTRRRSRRHPDQKHRDNRHRKRDQHAKGSQPPAKPVQPVQKGFWATLKHFFGKLFGKG